MSGPGQNSPGATDGITRPEDLPKAKVIHRSRNFSHRHCPSCGKPCFRSRTGKPNDASIKTPDSFAVQPGTNRVYRKLRRLEDR